MVRTGVAGMLVAGTLAGCSGGGNGAGAPPPFPPEPRTYDAIFAQGSDIARDWRAVEYTEPSTLPATGAATYTGVLAVDTFGYGLTADNSLAADLRLSADFSDDAMTGSATNFVSGRNERLAGAIAFENGSLDRDVNPNGGGWTFGSHDASGALTAPDGERWRVRGGTLLGDFGGEEPGLAGGILEFDLVSRATGDEVVAEGEFLAVRD